MLWGKGAGCVIYHMENHHRFKRFRLQLKSYHSHDIAWDSIKSLDGGSYEVDFIEDTHYSSCAQKEEIVFRPVINQNPAYHGIKDL